MHDNANDPDQPHQAGEDISSDPFHTYRAQHSWPPPPRADAALDASQPSPPPTPQAGSALRSVGVGALGLIGGFLAAVVLQDIVGVAFLRDGGEITVGLALIIGMLMPVLSIAGAVVAIVIDHAARTRQGRDRPRSPDEPR